MKNKGLTLVELISTLVILSIITTIVFPKIYESLNNAFNDNKYFSAKINFYISKNKNIFASLVDEIEEERLNIAQHYGVYDGNTGAYNIPADKIDQAQRELTDLLLLEQDVVYQTISFKQIKDAEFTMAQMDAIMFMIEEDFEEEEYYE